VLLSMFVFYVSRGGRTFLARCTIAAMSFRTFLCFAHGPPITPLHRCDRYAAHLARLGAIHLV
jgi:hypothetical protein